jgi:malate synthase
MSPAAIGRFRWAPVEGASELFTPAFVEYFVAVHDELRPRIQAALARRADTLQRALRQRRLPAHPPASAATTGDWTVPPVPADLQKPGIEISGPCSITSMFINALNPGPEGERAEGDLDDDEDSSGHRLVDTVRAALNRAAAVQRELTFVDRERNRDYRIAEGELPFFVHRERGIHLDEPEVTIDGAPVNAAVLGTTLTLYYAGRAQAERGQGIYFYLPKLELAPEARLYRDLFDLSRRVSRTSSPATA